MTEVGSKIVAALRFLLLLLACSVRVALGRLVRGPRLPGWSFRQEVVVCFLRSVMAWITRKSYVGIRKQLHDLSFALPADVGQELVQCGAVHGLRFEPPEAEEGQVIVYVHGGGYVVGSAAHEAPFAARLARATGRVVVSVDYRLAPEHPCPAAIHDVAEVVQDLLAAGQRVAVVGTSAGGALALTAVAELRSRGHALPELLVAISPFVDPKCERPSWSENAQLDWIELESARRAFAAYAGELSHEDPRVSPLRAELDRFPPLLLFSGSAECMRDDVVALEMHARQAGVSVTHLTEPRMTHVYPMLGIANDERRRCLSLIRVTLDGIWSPSA